MDLLVVGAGGLLGSNVVNVALEREYETVGTYHSTPPNCNIPLEQLDLEDTDLVGELLQAYDPDAVLNCAAMTDVDGCEDAPGKAEAVNSEAPGTLAAECADRDIDLVHVSTDYVFDGQGETPYDEQATPAPLQEYGRSKLGGERRVAAAHDGALITRLSFVWGIHRSSGELTGFPAWVRSRLAESEPTPLFTDQHVSPSRAGATAETILDLLEGSNQGLFNVAARSCVTPYEYGSKLCARLDADETLLEEGRLSDVDRPAARPSYTCLDVAKVENALGRRQPTLAEDLDAVESLV